MTRHRNPGPRSCSLRVRAGGAWEPVAKALHVEEDTIAKVAHGRSRSSPRTRSNPIDTFVNLLDE